MATPVTNPVSLEPEASNQGDASWPFLHEAAFKRLDRPQGLIIVHGMRGAGKSVLLRRLKEKSPHYRDAMLLAGRNRAETLRQLASFSTPDAQHPKGLLLDDVDLLLSDPLSGEIEYSVIERLWTLKEASFVGDWPFCMTISEPPGTFLEYNSRVSDLLTSGPRSITLKPWETDTRAILERAMEARFSEELEQEMPLRFFGHAFRFSDKFIQAWRDAIHELTGGHPTLVGPAMDLLIALLSTPPLLDEAGQQSHPAEPDPALLIPGIRAELARTGMIYVRRRIHALSTCTRPREKAAYAVLLDMARGQTPTAATLLNRIGMVLEREGLAYLHQPTGAYRFVGSMVEGAMKARLDNEQLTPRASKILLDPGPDPARGGVAYTVSPGGRREVELTGSLWAVLQVLDAHRSTYVSLNTLMEATQLKAAAARSALHRLSLRLREGLGTGIENAYGQGYRLS